MSRHRSRADHDRASTVDSRSITSYNDWCEDPRGVQPANGATSQSAPYQREKDAIESSIRDETHTMHAIPMIPNEDHDYGSRNFNQRDKKSINPVSENRWKLSIIIVCQFFVYLFRQTIFETILKLEQRSSLFWGVGCVQSKNHYTISCQFRRELKERNQREKNLLDSAFRATCITRE